MPTDQPGLIQTETSEVSQQILAGAFEVANVLGAGFLEKVYERALASELAMRGLHVETQVAMKVDYKNIPVGTYFADLVVERRLIVEVKCVNSLSNQHIAQCLNCLRASGISTALLLNFEKPRLQWKRILL